MRKHLHFILLLAASLTAGIAHAANAPIAGGTKPWWSKGTGIRAAEVDGKDAISISTGFIVQESIPVSGGRNYRFSIDVRTDDTTENALYVQASFRGTGVNQGWVGPLQADIDTRTAAQCGNAEGAVRQEKAMTIAGGNRPQWRRHSIVIAAPAGATQLVLYLRKSDCSPGTGYYADAGFTATTDDETAPLAALTASVTTEHVPPPATDTAENGRRLASQIERASAAATSHPFIDANTLAMRVHVGADESLMVLQAAADLQAYAMRVAGGPRPGWLSSDATVATEPLVIVGRRNAPAQAKLTDADFANLGDDGFLIRSLGPHIVIAGRTDRGTMYGVNWFLDRRLGIKWLSPDVTVVPQSETVTLPPQELREVPRFAFREVLSVEGEDKAWRQRNLMNGESHGPSFIASPPAIDSWDRSWASQGTMANFYELLPPKTYQAQHPGWYAGGQLAMMNPEMRAEMARIVIERLRALPDYRKIWFSIHDMDWGWDMDAASRAFAAQHGGHPSAPRLDMMIDIASQVRAALPDARLAFNAYHWSFTPPEGMTVPDHILVYPMTIHVNYAQALNEPVNAKLGEDIAGWNRIAKHVLVWDHITNFAGFLQPTPNLLPIGRSLQWLATLDKVQGYMGEGSFNTRGAEFAALRAWMISRLLWDPQQDEKALIEEFCNAYYGPAAGQILEYIRFYHDKIANSGDVLAEKTTVDMAMFDAEFVRYADGLFDAAEQAAAGTPYLKRVRAARMPVDYVILLRRAEYARLKDEIGFDAQATAASRRQRLEETITAEGVKQYMQTRGTNIAQLKSLLDIERKPATPPELATAGTDWHDIQDISFLRFAGDKSAVVTDSRASDGAAAVLDRSSTGWILQMKFDKLPKQGNWWLYAAVRAEGGDAGGSVANLGSAPPMGCFSPIPASPSQSEVYQWYEVPGGPFSYSTDHAQSIYLQPRSTEVSGKVFIDRIVALPQRSSDAVPTEATGACP